MIRKRFIRGEDWTIIRSLFLTIEQEMENAVRDNGEFASIHEGWAVLKEEEDELWDLVRQKDADRDGRQVTQEAVQVAASAIRIALQYGTGPKGS